MGILEAHNKRRQEDFWIAAHRAAFLNSYAHHQPRKMPKLDRLLAPSQPKHAQSITDQWHALRLTTTALGGTLPN